MSQSHSGASSEKNLAQSFERVIVIGRPSSKRVPATLTTLLEYFIKNKINYLLERQTSLMLANPQQYTPPPQLIDLETLEAKRDLLLVIGGDGSIIYAAQKTMQRPLPILGINRGSLGFLTDIAPTEIAQIGQVLKGHYRAEKRSMLSAEVYDQHGTLLPEGCGHAVNDVVLTPGNVAQMISFSISIDDEPVCQQRADGLIVATPTGSTAYALSAGGPIVHPQMDAVVLVPMLPHKLSSRPLVVASSSTIDIQIANTTKHSPAISCDGGRSIRIQPGYRIRIKPHANKLTLIHPRGYQYYDSLRQKLGWEQII